MKRTGTIAFAQWDEPPDHVDIKCDCCGNGVSADANELQGMTLGAELIGQRVSYDLVFDPAGKRAANVRPFDGREVCQ